MYVFVSVNALANGPFYAVYFESIYYNNNIFLECCATICVTAS